MVLLEEMSHRAETILMILTFVHHHRESERFPVTAAHLISKCSFIHKVFEKYFHSITNRFEIQFYCESCKGYICKEVTVFTRCPHCDLPFDLASNLKSGSFMIYLPLSSSLKDVLKSLQKNSQQPINKAEWVWDDTILDGDVVRVQLQNKTFASGI